MDTMKDPLQVKYWEQKLGRTLTEAEKQGQQEIEFQGHKIFLELTDLIFPYDFMDKIILHSINKKSLFSNKRGEE